MGTRIEHCRALCAWSVALATLLLAAGAPGASAADREQSTQLISHAVDGGLPNGPSTAPVISSDRRFARLIAFQSEASNLVRGDTNGRSDVFVVRRAGAIANDGAPWRIGATVLASRGLHGRPANGPSFAPAVSGSFRAPAACVTFLSAATNLVRGDTNHQVDAFLFRPATGRLRRVSLPRGRQANAPTTAAVVSGDCKRVAFLISGRLYVSVDGHRARRVRARGPLTDPAFSTGEGSDLVFAGPAGVYLSRMATKRPGLIVPGGRDPAFNDIKRQVVAYEKVVDGRSQVFARDLGRPPRLLSGYATIETPTVTISGTGWWPGEGDSRDPVIGNSGYYVTFESDAPLGTTASGWSYDRNKRPDIYLYTDVRKITLLESTIDKGHPLPGGGQHPSMSFYANYIVFDTPAPLGLLDGPPQIYMRWLGPV